MAQPTETERRWRTLIVAAVALAYPLGKTGFDVGAYGELLFENMLVAWTAVTATLVVFIVLPKELLPVPRWHAWFLVIPSLWMLARFFLGISYPGAIVHPAVFVFGVVSFAICFPYALYLIVRMANPDLTDIKGARLWSTLAVIGGTFFLSGYFIGSWNKYFVSCQEARVGRIELPAYCRNVTNDGS